MTNSGLISRARERLISSDLLQTQTNRISMSEYSTPLETMHPTGTTLVRKMSPKGAFALVPLKRAWRLPSHSR